MGADNALHQPTEKTREQAKLLSGYGVPHEGIAAVLGIGVTTLRKYYTDDMHVGAVTANAKVAQNLFKMASGDGRQAVTAAIFWLKTRARWKETPVEVEVKDVTEDRTNDTRAKGMALLLAKRAANDNRRTG